MSDKVLIDALRRARLSHCINKKYQPEVVIGKMVGAGFSLRINVFKSQGISLIPHGQFRGER
ncbi:MAG: hypothetical protein ABIL86_10525 [candidate division WOR-3 bacterium]